MSSGWSEYVVESAEAKERRLLAAAIARRDGLLSDLAGITGELRSLGLPAIADFGPAPGTSEEVEAQCGELQRLISEARSGIEKELARRQQDTARRQLAEAISGFTVSPEIAAALAEKTSTRNAERQTGPRPPELADLARDVVERQLVADPAVSEQAAEALAASPERSRMLLRLLRDEVDSRNARHREALRAAEQQRTAALESEAETAARCAEEGFVADAVRASLQAIGYQPTPLLAEGAEDALIVTHAAFPQHAVMARTRTGRIELDALRIAGPADTAADTQAEKALCDALAAFRAELEKRGIRQNRVSHLPAGLRPLAHQQVTRRATEQRRTTEQEQRR